MCNGGQLSLKQRLILEFLLDEGTKQEFKKQRLIQG